MKYVLPVLLIIAVGLLVFRLMGTKDEPSQPPQMEMPMNNRPVPTEHQTNKPRTQQESDLQIEKAENGYSVAELMKGKKKLAGKEIRVRGKVIKVNNMIMNRNWVHIQDGSSHDKQYDLTLTTDEKVEEGSIVTFKGTLTVDKDFGAGYFYKLIIEDASIVQE